MLHILALTLHRFTGSTCFVACNVSNGMSIFPLFQFRTIYSPTSMIAKHFWNLLIFSQIPKIVRTSKMESINAVISRLCCDGNAPLHEFASSKTKRRLACLHRLDSAAVVFVCESSVCVHKSVHEKSKKQTKKKSIYCENVCLRDAYVCAERAYWAQCVWETDWRRSERRRKIYILKIWYIDKWATQH